MLPLTSRWVAAAILLVTAIGTSAAETPAGAIVTNVARVSAKVGDASIAVESNADRFVIAERLDVVLEQPLPTPAPVADGVVVPVLLTNRGNGQEAFSIVASAADGPSVRGIAVDVDGNGLYDASRDILLTSGTTPSLAGSGAIPLLVLIDGAAGSVTLVARAATGSGALGTTFVGKGDGGGDAATGATGAEARLLILLDEVALPKLQKSQAVRAPDGTDRPEPGAVVTYTLQATFPGTRRAARIDDPLPAGVRFVPGSLSLDGVALTDAADDDAGSFDGSAVAVVLGDVAASAVEPVTRTLTFQAVLR